MIKAFMNVLRPAPYLPEVTDPIQVAKDYRYWRIRTFYSMYIGYLFYYFSRKSFAFITPFLTTDLGLTKGDIGFLASIFALTYGFSRFVSSVLCDRSNPRYFMAIGLILTGVCNLFFGFFSSVIIFGFFWGINGLFQGWGWPACAKQLTYWYSRTERGTWWSACATSHTLGGFLIAYLAAYCAKWYGWRFGMYIPGFLCIGVGCWLLNRLRDVPQSLGLPPIERYKGEPIIEQEQEKETNALPVKEMLFRHVLNNKFVWVLAIAYFFTYVVRIAVNDWGPLYLAEMKGFSPLSAAACVSWFEVGGFFGILVAGWGSDYWFQGKRIPLVVIAFMGLIFSLLGFWYLEAEQFILTSIIIGLIGFLVFIPQMLVGLAAAEFVTKKAASTSNGFASFCSSFGAVMAGYPLGKVAEIYGWHEFMMILVACSAIGMIVLLPIWSVQAGTRKVEEGSIVLETNPSNVVTEN